MSSGKGDEIDANEAIDRFFRRLQLLGQRALLCLLKKSCHLHSISFACNLSLSQGKTTTFVSLTIGVNV